MYGIFLVTRHEIKSPLMSEKVTTDVTLQLVTVICDMTLVGLGREVVPKMEV